MRTASWTYRRFSACSSASDRGPSRTDAEISSPRCAGMQCSATTCGVACARSYSFTSKPAKRDRRSSASASRPMLVHTSV